MVASDSQQAVVTGGSGFIGRAVVSALRARGIAVTVVDRHPFETTDPGITMVTGDLADAGVRETAIQPGTLGVVNLAAITSVLKSVEMPADTFTQNVAITQELLELCRRHEVPRFLQASTNAVIGDVGSSTITADRPLQPLTPYGATKAAAEMLISGYAGSYGLAGCALRFTNVYGPGMAHKDSFVPRLMRAAMNGTTVKIYGDGEQRRDLVHVDDVARGVMLAWDAKHTGRVILGSGQSVSVLELIDTVRAVTGAALPVEHIPAPAGEMPAVVVDLEPSAEAIGYRPAIDLDSGLAEVWKDFQASAP